VAAKSDGDVEAKTTAASVQAREHTEYLRWRIAAANRGGNGALSERRGLTVLEGSAVIKD
jgi:hypothetical protein